MTLSAMKISKKNEPPLLIVDSVSTKIMRQLWPSKPMNDFADLFPGFNTGKFPQKYLGGAMLARFSSKK
jgi:hypothetical protein